MGVRAWTDYSSFQWTQQPKREEIVMPNANSIWSFTGPSAGSGNVITTAAAFTYPVGGAAIIAGLPANGEYKNRLLRWKAAARIQPGTTGNVTMSLYSGLTVAAGTIMATTGAVSCTANCSAVIDAYGHWNDDTDTILGWQTGIMGATPTLTTLAILTANVAANPNPSIAATQSFFVSILFGTTNAANTAFLEEFSIDLV
jgi:hypothetical protein